ncbi:MAG: AraC family transcriptional regulator [bacterium]
MAKHFISREVFNNFPFHCTFLSCIEKTTDIHNHDFYELFLVSKGSIIHLINRKVQELKENTLILIRPGDTHHFKKLENQLCYLCNLAFTKNIFTTLKNYINNNKLKTLIKSELPCSVTISNEKKYYIQNQVEKINTISQSRKNIKKIQYHTLLLDMISEFFYTEYNMKKNVPDWLNYIYKEMQKKENFLKGREVIIDLSPNSEAHTCRMFKKYFQKTPTEFVNNLRLNYASNLILNTDEEIQEIVYKTGFNNINYFYKLFKEKYHIPPGKYRKNKQKYTI